MPEYRGAVLIIGSLWWDTSPIRENWRNTRLELNKKQVVTAPIRYGRKSSSRGNTYTMVFSRLCYRNTYGLGQALLAPFQRPVQSANDLILEASELWKAESNQSENRSSTISASWGAIGLLIRSDSDLPKEIVQGWIHHYQNQPRHPHPVHLKTEKPVINENGLLNIRWLYDDQELDFILATATQPTLISKRYPSARVIAQSWLDDTEKNVGYFHNNRSNDITTFQDENILKFLETKK